MAAKIPPAVPDNGGRGGALPFHKRLLYVALCGFTVLAFGTLLNGAMLRDTVVVRGIDGIPPAREVLNAVATSAATDRILFVGNSQFLRGIQPDIMDQEFARAGCNAAAFVAAYPNLNSQEAAQIIGAAQALGDRGPTRIVLSATIPSLSARTNPLSIDAPLLLHQTEYEFSRTGPSLTHKLVILRGHVRSILSGLLSFRRLRLVWPVSQVSYDETIRGYLPYAGSDPSKAREIERALALRQGSEGHAPRNVALVSRAMPLAPRELMRWATQIDASVPLMLLTMPTLDESNRFGATPPGWIQQSASISFLNLNDERFVPRLVNASFWHDANHLSNDGAAEISSALVRYLCAPIEREDIHALR